MDGVLFEAWLESIRLLTARQRQAGFACLALAEADDDWDSISSDTAPHGRLSAEDPSGASDGLPPETRRPTETAHRFCRPPPWPPLKAGSSTADVRIVPPESCNAGVGSAICRATAAEHAGAPSTG